MYKTVYWQRNKSTFGMTTVSFVVNGNWDELFSDKDKMAASWRLIYIWSWESVIQGCTVDYTYIKWKYSNKNSAHWVACLPFVNLAISLATVFKLFSHYWFMLDICFYSLPRDRIFLTEQMKGFICSKNFDWGITCVPPPIFSFYSLCFALDTIKVRVLHMVVDTGS